MVLKRVKNEVRAALATRIMDTCKQIMPEIEEIYIEGLLGITLNKREIFLVNLSDIYSNDESSPKKKKGKRQGTPDIHRYRYDSYTEDNDMNDPDYTSSIPVSMVTQQSAISMVEQNSTYYIKEEDMFAPDISELRSRGYSVSPSCHRNVKYPELDSPSVANSDTNTLEGTPVNTTKVTSSGESVLDLSMRRYLDAMMATEATSDDVGKNRRKRGRPRKISDPEDVVIKSPTVPVATQVLDLTRHNANNQSKSSCTNGAERNTENNLENNEKPSNGHNSKEYNADGDDSQSESPYQDEMDQSEESLQGLQPMGSSGAVFPHLEEYDSSAFDSSMNAMNDTFDSNSLDSFSGMDSDNNNESKEEDKEVTSTGRPRRKASLSPWARQYFNVSTGGSSESISEKRNEARSTYHKPPQTCPECHKVFSAGSHLKRHFLVTHTNSRKFQCRVCEKRFGSNDHLKRHMATHSNERNYKCHLCQRAFNIKYRLSEHIIEKHGKEALPLTPPGELADSCDSTPGVELLA